MIDWYEMARQSGYDHPKPFLEAQCKDRSWLEAAHVLGIDQGTLRRAMVKYKAVRDFTPRKNGATYVLRENLELLENMTIREMAEKFGVNIWNVRWAVREFKLPFKRERKHYTPTKYKRGK